MIEVSFNLGESDDVFNKRKKNIFICVDTRLC